MQALSRRMTGSCAPLTRGRSPTGLLTKAHPRSTTRSGASVPMPCRSFSAEACRQPSSCPSTSSVSCPGWVTSNGVTDEVMSRDELRSLPGAHRTWIAQLEPSASHQDRRDARPRGGHRITPPAGAVALYSEVSPLAFPYGEYDEQVVGARRQAGYERVFGIRPVAGRSRRTRFRPRARAGGSK